ncbi:ClpP/crotonase-like domain-containing protein [Dactylonectria macrodidyma]|uniref:ClpP/crotonase-like domain-containing protein n=1 Tax=Dactylonectria macrodidyma TaxID=307937 RepID=A0A9P9CX37_9HYPO|nr:ClpP/crotonase-like domain-containing protein [Dactylonectria macrodidyma]
MVKSAGSLVSPNVNGVVRITIHNGGSNLWDWKLNEDVAEALDTFKDNTEVKVVIFSSANPNFFIAHYDMRPSGPEKLFQNILFKMLRSPIVFIAEIAGVARGIGSEFALHCDMRFAARGKTRLGQPEVRVGLLPGAGGIQQLVQLLGRGRAFQHILTGVDIDADTAERIGWINQAFEAEELSQKVGDLAKRIALFPSDALAASKESINACSCPSESDILRDTETFFTLMTKDTQRKLARKLYEVTKGLDYHDGPVDDDKVLQNLYEN